MVDNKLTRQKLSLDQIHPTTLRKRDSNPIVWCLLNFTIIYIHVNAKTHLSKSKRVRSSIQNIITFCQIFGVHTSILSITTCSSLSCLANGIAHLAVDVYATSDCSAIPTFIFENCSQAYILLLIWPIKIKLYPSVRWLEPSPSPVLPFKWSHLRVILIVKTMH